MVSRMPKMNVACRPIGEAKKTIASSAQPLPAMVTNTLFFKQGFERWLVELKDTDKAQL